MTRVIHVITVSVARGNKVAVLFYTTTVIMPLVMTTTILDLPLTHARAHTMVILKDTTQSVIFMVVGSGFI